MANDNTIFTLLNAVTGTGAGSGVGCATLGAQVHVYSAAGSSCTVLIQGSQDNTTWKTLVTLTDPAAAPAGDVYQGTAMPYMRANVSARVSGTISATMIALSHDPGPWATITEPTNTAGAISCTALTNSALTSGRVPYATTGGLLTDEAALAYNAGTNTLTVGELIDSALTAGRIVFAGSSKELDDAAGLAWDGSFLTAPAIKNTAGTATRVLFHGSSKELTDDSTFTFNATTKAVAATIFKGGAQQTVAVHSGDGAISVAPQLVVITKGSAAALTLAAPTVTDHDGYVIDVFSTTAQAHVITFASGKINGGSNVTLTLGGAIADGVTLRAYNGVWYTVAGTNFTVAP